MSRKITARETEVTDRFDEFVTTHAERAAFWYMVASNGAEPGTFIDHVEFEGDADLRMMDVLTAATLDTEEDRISVEHGSGLRIKVTDSKNELGILTGVEAAHRKRNWVAAVESLMNHLVELEDAGHFVPASQRYRDLTLAS